MEEMLIHTVEQPAAPAQPETMPQPAPAEPTVLPKPPVPVRDRVLSFGLLILGYLVCRSLNTPCWAWCTASPSLA